VVSLPGTKSISELAETEDWPPMGHVRKCVHDYVRRAIGVVEWWLIRPAGIGLGWLVDS